MVEGDLLNVLPASCRQKSRAHAKSRLRFWKFTLTTSKMLAARRTSPPAHLKFSAVHGIDRFRSPNDATEWFVTVE